VSVSVLFPHKIKSKELESLASDYLKLASRYRKIDFQVAPLMNRDRSATATLKKSMERQPLFLLSERGTPVDTPWFVEKLSNSAKYPGGVAFAVGDVFGYPQQCEDKAAGLISLTPLTLPHELALVILLEQLWRAVSIINNHPYHK